MCVLFIASWQMLCNASRETPRGSSACWCLDDALRVRQSGGDCGSVPPEPVEALDRKLS